MGGWNFRSSPVILEAEDTHGYFGVAKNIAEAIREFDPPATVALCGSYGSGKSSIVSMALTSLGFCKDTVIDLIRGTDSATTEGTTTSPMCRANASCGQLSLGVVFFDASLWQDNPSLFGALLLSMAKQFGISDGLTAAIKSIGLSFWATLSYLGAVGSLSDAKKEAEAIKQMSQTRCDQVTLDAENRLTLKKEIREFLGRLTKKISEANDGVGPHEVRLVVILDNLDRVLPSQTLDLLRDVHTYIGNNRDMPVTVLACFDRELIEGFMSRQLGIKDTAGYLCKYVDFFFGMPLPKDSYIEKVISKHLELAPSGFAEPIKKLKSIFSAMLHSSGPTNPRILEVVLRRFKFLLHLNRDKLEQNSAHDASQGSQGYSSFDFAVVGLLWHSVVYTQWPSAYAALYRTGRARPDPKDDIAAASQSIRSLVSSLLQAGDVVTEAYLSRFLEDYQHTVLWYDPGAALRHSFEPFASPEGELRIKIIEELGRW
ncbi:MAG: hypothetical protein HY675_00465 [Chloroflexi bacterium]|nr:hypothetical protein [Chloroflexota bacterium]